MPRSWDDLKPVFDVIVFRETVDKVAKEISADRVTVYRLVNGATSKPRKRLHEAIEKLVDDRR